jgi:FkbM family methyltransferase
MERFFMTRKTKEWLRAAAKHWRVDLVRKPRAVLDRPAAELQFNVEYAIAHALLSRDQLTIVQVGANDGQTDDPINRLLRLDRCRGILAEPNPESFQRLQETYKDCPHLNLCNAAISEKDGTATLYSLSRSAPVPDWMHGLASFSREHVLRHDGFVKDIARYIVESTVECVTFDTLLRRYPVGHVDVLQIDTEGFDAEILRLFNVPARRPAIINFEHRHLSEADWNKSIEALIPLGYKIAIVQQDTLAYLPSGATANGAGH